MTHLGIDRELGIRTPKHSKIFAIVNPTSLVRKNISLQCNSNVYKNWPLGHGRYRVAGNLGPLMQMTREVKDNGFDDVMWMIDDYIKELNIHNVFVLWKSRFGKFELITPPDDGCIFNSNARRSIIEIKDKIKKEMNVDVVERNMSIHEIFGAQEEGRLSEFFGVSTGSIHNVTRLAYGDR
jgi:branched-subunit amino acid aminotransferase/4-amino-4-deoxychorismate lyase